MTVRDRGFNLDIEDAFLLRCTLAANGTKRQRAAPQQTVAIRVKPTFGVAELRATELRLAFRTKALS